MKPVADDLHEMRRRLVVAAINNVVVLIANGEDSATHIESLTILYRHLEDALDRSPEVLARHAEQDWFRIHVDQAITAISKVLIEYAEWTRDTKWSNVKDALKSLQRDQQSLTRALQYLKLSGRDLLSIMAAATKTKRIYDIVNGKGLISPKASVAIRAINLADQIDRADQNIMEQDLRGIHSDDDTPTAYGEPPFDDCD